MRAIDSEETLENKRFRKVARVEGKKQKYSEAFLFEAYDLS
jgi:hypothetical protein